MSQFFIRELQWLQTSDQVQKLVVNDCQMSSTKNWGVKFVWNTISRSWNIPCGPHQATRLAAGCTCLVYGFRFITYDAPFHFRIHLLSMLNSFSWKHYVLCSIVCSTDCNRVANPVACHGSTENASSIQSLTIPGLSDVDGGRTSVGYVRHLSGTLGAFSLLRAVLPELT